MSRIPTINTFAHQLSLLQSDLLRQNAISEEYLSIEEETRAFSQAELLFKDAQSQASKLVDALDCALNTEGWEPPSALEIVGNDAEWEYGLIPRLAPLRPILRGFLQPVRYVPLVERVPEKVILYLTTMFPRDGDGLVREEHGGVKWHFHYIDERRRRSDVILSFDTRWSMAVGAKGLDKLRPLFVERHAEGKAKFKARPEHWKDEKRESIYQTCARDLDKEVSLFRCAKNDSDPVWPRNAVLTPHLSGATKGLATAKHARKSVVSRNSNAKRRK